MAESNALEQECAHGQQGAREKIQFPPVPISLELEVETNDTLPQRRHTKP